MVEVVGRLELPKGAGGGTKVTVGSSGSAVTVRIGFAVTTIVVVVEPFTTSTVMTPTEGVTVTVAVDATVWFVVSVTV
jgi:hypothetical protein